MFRFTPKQNPIRRRRLPGRESVAEGDPQPAGKRGGGAEAERSPPAEGRRAEQIHGSERERDGNKQWTNPSYRSEKKICFPVFFLLDIMAV